jgi:polyhydroxyalkanoate synthesis regulator phasin
MNARNKMTGLLSAALIAVSAMGIVGCAEVTSPADDMPMALAAATIPAPEMETGIFYEGSLDQPMAVERPGSDMNRHPFGSLLRALKLTPEQQETVKGLLAAHEDCMKEALMGLRKSEREILAPFNARRDAIREKVKNGEMTREEARAALADLNKAAREALRGNTEARKAAGDAIKKCREDFMTSLRGILTEEQIPVLRRWLAGNGPRDPRGGSKDTTNVGPGGPRGGDSNTGDSTGVRPGTGGRRP